MDGFEITTLFPKLDDGTFSREDLANRFSVVDYIVFGLMLAVSAAIGIFYGCFGKKQDTNEFLMAGKSMTTFPVAMSLIASFMSAVTLLGTPSEVYKNGFTYWLIGLSYFTVMPVAAYLYVPVFWKLQVTSAYEYLEVRFSRPVRMLGSFIFIIQMCLYMAIVVYAPALALAQVTGMNVYLSVCLICFVCIFYTTIGGMKAVLWTDALQVIIMYATMFGIIFYGTYEQGGFNKIWEAGTRGNRTVLIDWDPNPRTRHTFWTLMIGGYVTWITIYACNQAQVQRYLCVKEKYMAVRALWINMVGLLCLMIVCAFGGLVLYSKYEGCDPVKAGVISKDDQLFPLYVMETIGNYKGIPGLFVAGIFSGALSTVSSGMNSLATITLEDFVKGGCFPNISERNATILSKFLSLFYGLLTFALVFVAENLGDVLSAALSIFGMIGGPLYGTFTLGMFFPWANALGAFVGTVVGLLLTLFIGVGNQVFKAYGIIPSGALPVRTDYCPGNITIESHMMHNVSFLDAYKDLGEDSYLYQLFTVSYLWYSAIGCFSVIFFGMVISLVTGLADVSRLNPDAFSPFLYWIKPILPGLSKLGLNYDPFEQKGLSDSKNNGSLGGGIPNLGYADNLPPIKNGHILVLETAKL